MIYDHYDRSLQKRLSDCDLIRLVLSTLIGCSNIILDNITKLRNVSSMLFSVSFITSLTTMFSVYFVENFWSKK